MKTLRIGCASAFWGDTNTAAAQLVEKGNIDYLVFDYLAEITMSILAAKRLRDVNDGYATDFVEHVMAPLLPQLRERGIKVVANAGGVNPLACKKALEAVAEMAGLPLSVAVVLGDDLLPRRKEFADCVEIDSATRAVEAAPAGRPIPPMLVSMNAYLGALPIARALAEGADVVITGRCVDSAVVLGPLMHEFGWKEDQYDLLAAGSIAVHRRQLHRLGAGEGRLCRHGLSDRRDARGRRVHGHQAGRHRRPGVGAYRAGTDALRDR